MVARIDRLTVAEGPKSRSKRQSGATAGNVNTSARTTERPAERRPRKWSADQEMWKKQALESDARDSWAFDKWVEQKARPARGPVQKRPLLL